MDKKDEFDLDFDFEKEYGFDPDTLLEGDYGDAELNLGDDFLTSEDFAAITGDDAPAAPAEPEFLQDEFTSQEPVPEEAEAPAPQVEEDAPKAPPRRRRSFQHALSQEPAEPAPVVIPESQEPKAEAPAGEASQQPVRRRRKKTKTQVFKEVYLPPIIAGLALILILVFVIGSITRGIRQNGEEDESKLNASMDAENEADRLDREAAQIVEEAAALAASYDYEAAIALIDSFSGEITAYPEMVSAKSGYSKEMSLLNKWDDPSKIANLSFHVLIADPSRAFINEEYGRAYNRNFVTIDEFQEILKRLYNNGYVLVGLDDVVTTSTTADGSITYVANPIYLPEGKKPIMITETLAMGLVYMLDSDGDKAPDKGGAGFASKLVLQNGEIKAEMVDAEGNTIVGDYDLVPVLNTFIEEHPDFSYRGARALLGVCGYDGVFGYRTQKGDEAEVAAAKEVVQALRDQGYIIGCYSYDNINYGSGNQNAASIQKDLESWSKEVAPVLGTVDVLIFAGGGDLAEYSGNKFDVVYSAGFRYFIGAANEPWASVTNTYFRQKRMMVTGSQMAYGSSIFNDYFSSMSILNELRGTVPN